MYLMERFYQVRKDGVYVSGNVLVAPRPAERVLVDLYYRFESQRLLPVIFHEGDPPNLRWFLDTFLDPEKSTLIAFREYDEAPTTGLSFPMDGKFYVAIGMGWFNKTWKIGVNFSKSETGMAFVRRTPIEESLAAGKTMLAWCFDNIPVDAVIGSTPEPNRAAVLYGQKIGFQQTTPLEGYTAWNGKLCSVVLQSMTRKRWMGMLLDDEQGAA